MLKSYSSREIINIITQDGWRFIEAVGSHHHFKHPVKKGKVTVPHPRKDLDPKTAKSILKQAGIN
jgi:predicted RNA binding protein YcfA (HicA-like mRNA interferase family)